MVKQPRVSGQFPWWMFSEVRGYLLTAWSVLALGFFAQVIYLAYKVDPPFVTVFGVISTIWGLLWKGPQIHRTACEFARAIRHRRGRA